VIELAAHSAIARRHSETRRQFNCRPTGSADVRAAPVPLLRHREHRAWCVAQIQ